MPDIFIPLSLGFLSATEPPAEAPAAPVPPVAVPVPAASVEHLSMSVDELELSVRTANCLQSARLRYVGEVVRMSEIELLKLKSFGGKSLRELREIFADMDLSIGMDVGDWTPPEDGDDDDDDYEDDDD